jgi:hypothetical protein
MKLNTIKKMVKGAKMTRQLYKVYFWATYKKDNKRALVPVFIPKTKQSLTKEQQIELGTQALKTEGYYDISYGSTIATELIFAD